MANHPLKNAIEQITGQELIGEIVEIAERRATPYGASPIKCRRRRRSKAEIETIKTAIQRVLTDENPMTLSTADVLTSNATNAVGFAFTGAGTADWKAVSVNGAADGAITRCNTGGATTPVLLTWQTFKVVLNQDGDADYYIDGVFHVREDAAVSVSTLLAVGIAQQEGGTARSTDVDYIYVSAGRL